MTLLDLIDQWCAAEQTTSRPDRTGRALTVADGLALDLSIAPDAAEGAADGSLDGWVATTAVRDRQSAP